MGLCVWGGGCKGGGEQREDGKEGRKEGDIHARKERVGLLVVFWLSAFPMPVCFACLVTLRVNKHTYPHPPEHADLVALPHQLCQLGWC